MNSPFISIYLRLGVRNFAIELTMPKIRTLLYYTFYLICGFITGLIFWPLALLVWSGLKIIRIFLKILLDIWYSRDSFQLVNGGDGIYSYKGSNSSIPGPYIIAYFILNENESKNVQNPLNIDEILNQPKFEKLKWRFGQKFWFSTWDKRGVFDYKKHFKNFEGINENEILNYDKLIEITQKITTTDFLPDLPQWEFWIFPNQFQINEDLPEKDRNFLIICRIHHAYQDGVAFAMACKELADSKKIIPTIDPFKKLEIPKYFWILITLKSLWIGPILFSKGLFNTFRNQYWLKSIFVRNLGSKCENNELQLGLSKTINISILKDIKRYSGTSISAILNASIALALKSTHEKLFPQLKIPSWTMGSSIFAMGPYSEDKLQNRSVIIPYKISIDVNDCMDNGSNLRKYLKMSKGLKEQLIGSDLHFFYYFKNFYGELPTFLKHPFLRFMSLPFILTNIPGDDDGSDQISFSGKKLVDAGFWPPVLNFGMIISTFSLKGQLKITVTANPTIMKDRKIVQEFTDEIRQNLLYFHKILSQEGYINDNFVEIV